MRFHQIIKMTTQKMALLPGSQNDALTVPVFQIQQHPKTRVMCLRKGIRSFM